MLKVSFKKAPQGFTLVELLIVISIIAILSIIAIIIYSNIQRDARDTKRKADVDAVASALEVHFDASAQRYNALDDTWFSSGGIPRDSFNGQTSCQGNLCLYCNLGSIGNCTSTTQQIAGGGSPNPPVNSTSWIICTNLESGTPSYYCRKNQQ